MSTGLYCCDCGKELEHNEDVTVIAGAYIEYEFGEYVTMPTDEPNFSTLCKDCSNKVLYPKPNRVVVEVIGPSVSSVRAERPDEVVVIVHQTNSPLNWHCRPQVFGGPDGKPIGQLNAVKVEPGEEGIPWAEYQPFAPEI